MNPVLKDILLKAKSSQRESIDQENCFITAEQNELVNKETINYFTESAFKISEIKHKMKTFKNNQVYFKHLELKDER